MRWRLLQASTGGASQVPRRVGRPVKYQGDINSPLLSEGDRSRLLRRVENRQAARRLRAKQHDTLKNALSKVACSLLLRHCYAGNSNNSALCLHAVTPRTCPLGC